jgi:homoserine kinase
LTNTGDLLCAWCNATGREPSECADNDGHNTDAIDALTLTVPVIIAFAQADRALRNAMVRDTIAVTRRSTVMQRYAEQYADLLVAGM